MELHSRNLERVQVVDEMITLDPGSSSAQFETMLPPAVLTGKTDNKLDAGGMFRFHS